MSIRKPLAVAAALLLTAGLAACSSDDGTGGQLDAQGTTQVQTGEQEAPPPEHGQIITAEQAAALPGGLVAHELPDGEFIALQEGEPLPEPVIDHLRSLIVVDPPQSLDEAVDSGVHGEAAAVAARLAAATGRIPAYVYNVGRFDGDGTLMGELWMIEAGGEAADKVTQTISSGDYVQLTYPTYDEAMAELEARVADTSDPDAYELIELAR